MTYQPTHPAQPTDSTQSGVDPRHQRAVDSRAMQRHPRALGGDPVRRLETPIVSLTDQILNNADGGKSVAPIKRKPKWMRAKLPGGPEFSRLRGVLQEHSLNTVCEEAGCPNMGECWARGVVTIMILGDTCTRSCGFCNVKTGKPPVTDYEEPRRVAESMRLMVEEANLRHIVITSVDRDDLPDGGASIWAETVVRTREACPELSIEILVPDFQGNDAAIDVVIASKPDILNHNLETVRRMYPAVRPQAKFDQSLYVLRRCRDAGLVTKTGIMVGIGERDDEVLELLDDVQAQAGTEILTIGQYLQPTPNHLPIDRFVDPAVFDRFKEQALARGFVVVESGPMVRSSYHADTQAAGVVDRVRASRTASRLNCLE